MTKYIVSSGGHVAFITANSWAQAIKDYSKIYSIPRYNIHARDVEIVCHYKDQKLVG